MIYQVEILTQSAPAKSKITPTTTGLSHFNQTTVKAHTMMQPILLTHCLSASHQLANNQTSMGKMTNNLITDQLTRAELSKATGAPNTSSYYTPYA